MENQEAEYTPEQLKAQLQAALQEVAHLREAYQDASLTIEVVNDRWIKAVNENMQLEITLRKMNNGNTN